MKKSTVELIKLVNNKNNDYFLDPETYRLSLCPEFVKDHFGEKVMNYKKITFKLSKKMHKGAVEVTLLREHVQLAIYTGLPWTSNKTSKKAECNGTWPRVTAALYRMYGAPIKKKETVFVSIKKRIK